jgi:tetratricopeptide (TPR) repeat protein
MKSVQHIYSQRPYKPFGRAITGLLLLLCVSSASGREAADSIRTKLTAEIRKTGSDSLRIEKLSKLAFYYNEVHGDRRMADSISQEAIELAENSFRPGLLLLAYNSYIECNDPAANAGKSLNYALEAVKLSRLQNKPALVWRSYSNLVKVYLAAYRYNEALGSSYQALAQADAMEDEPLRAESYLLIGQSLEGNNQKIEAFRNYLNAVSLAEKTREPALLKKCYSQLSAFYNYNKMFEKASVYKLRQIDLIAQSLPLDSLELMWAKYDLQAISINSNNNRLNNKSMQEVLDFAIRNNYTRLKNYEITLYRSHLIEANKIDQLYQLYNKQYPHELSDLETKNPSMYYRLKAYFEEEDHQPESARYYLEKAEEIIRTDPNKILQSNFYQRFGQFLKRQGQNREAIEKYTESYELASKASYFEYMLSSSKNLESLYHQLGDDKNAYAYSVLNRSLADSVRLLTQNDEMLMMEIDHESKQRELAAEQQHIETHRRHNIQYTAITIIIIASFILLMMLGSLKVPSWTIKLLGFFSFILFFEFIIMIADHKIYDLTASEPWKILLIKIGLIAFLLPFHHWIEKRVTQYLIEHKLIRIPRITFRQILRKKTPSGSAKS